MSNVRGGTSYGGYDVNLSGDALHLRDYVRVIYRRRWIASTCFVLVVLSTIVVTFTATPTYEATAQILIDNEDPNIVTFEQVLNESQRTNEYYQTQYRVLQSRALARRTIETLQLWNHPQFNSQVADGANARWTLSAMVNIPVEAFTKWIRNRLSQDQVAEHAAPNETAVQSATIARFLRNLTVSPVRNTQLVDVLYRSPDAALAANVANTLVKGYIDQNLEYKLLSSREATDWLAQQLAEQRKEVEVTERALQEYRERTDSVSLEDRQNIVVQKLGDLNAAVTRARTDRIQKEAAYNQIRAVQNNRATLDTLSAIVSNTFIQEQKAQLAQLQVQQAQLTDKLGPRHPDMLKLGLTIEGAQKRIDAEIAKVIESLRNDHQQALAQEQSLSAALDQQKQEALDLNRKAIGYNVLARDAAANRQLLESVMHRMKETDVASELKTSNIRVIDEAEVPRSAASPRKARNLLFSLPIGLILAVGLAFFFEYLDDRLRKPEDIQQYLGIAHLGMVPALSKKDLEVASDGTANTPLMNGTVPASFVESFRALRTNLIFSSADEGGRSVVVTSTGPAEGKTLVASNVATALALAGQRVLLIDADMRKPRVHQIFKKARNPGLSDVLVGTAKAAGAVQKTDVPTLWVLPAGQYPPNPAELLASKRFKDFLTSLGQHFDWLVIDTPPVMAVTDAVVVAHGTSAVLFVVGSEMTARGAAQRALEQLEHGNAKVVGAVLNRVDLQHNGYYYSNYYRRAYREYYETST